MNLQVKQRIPLKIKRMGINGEGIGFYKKTLVFVPGALKGEEVFCQGVSVKRNFVQAKLLKINKPSKFRVEPACSIYEDCGGCQLMHLRYDKQLEFKTDLLGQALKKFKPANFESYDIRPTIGMEQPQHYRAKLQFQTRSFDGSVKAGLFAEGSHRLINIDDCLVQDDLTQAIMNKVTNLLDKYKFPIYNERKIAGIRTVMIRRALGSNQVQLIFVTSKSVSFTKLVKELTESFPEIVKLLIENGLQSTLILFFLTLIFGLILGMIIAKGRMSKLLIIQMPIRFFLLIMRGTPLILQLYGFYFGLYYIAGLSLDRMTAAVISFSLNYAAYFAEIYRSGIQAIPKGQYEAAKVLGFNRSQTFFKIILPQVVKIITPSLGSECMTLVKDTSLAHVIGVMEIYVVATNQMARSRGMIYLVVAGIFYLIMNAIVSKVFSVIEKRMNYYR